VNVEIRYRGKTYTGKEIDEIKEVIATYRERSRLFISQEICRRWGWAQPNGILKDMICRGLLLQLEAQGKVGTWDVVQSIQITFPSPTSLLAL
jgi:hypothetical protein